MSQTRRTRLLATAPTRALSVLVCAVVTFTAAACSPGGGTESTADSSDEPLVIGMSLPLSGPVADRAKPGYEGYQYWVDELNANGGLLGRQVELNVLDDGFDPNVAISGYNKLISQDRVDLLLGTFSSDLNIAVAPVAERNQYVYVEPSGGADEIFARDFKFLFFAQPATTERLPDRFVDLIEAMPEAGRPKTAAYVQQEDPNTSQAAALFKERLEPLGVSMVYDATYAPDTSNFDTIANAVKQADPDLVISGAVGGDGIALIRSFQKIGFSPEMLYQLNSPTDPSFASAIGEANTEGIFTPLAWSAESTFGGNSEFVSGYTEKFGAPPVEDAANSYTAGQVLAAAVEAVGELDQPAIAEWLHNNEVETIVGPLSWDAAGKPKGSLLLAQFQAGQLQIVAPSDAATAEEIVYSKPTWQ